jgi:hypothetical protein
MEIRLLKQRTAVARYDLTNGEGPCSRAEIQGKTSNIFWCADSPTWVHTANGVPVGVIYVPTAANAG